MPTTQFRLFSLPVISWALYDFANTIFSFAIGSVYFNTWIVEDRKNPDWYLAAMTVVVTLALVATMPPLGAIADRYGARKPFLMAFTLLSVGATLVLGFVDSTSAALVTAGIAIFGFQSALTHYDPLLVEVAPREKQGRVSGFGVGVGYMGTFVALFGLAAIVGDGSRQNAFVPTAMLYLVFSLPIFLFVRERRQSRDAGDKGMVAIASEAVMQLRATAHNLRGYRDVLRLVLARFLYVDALAVVILYMGIYLDRLGFDKDTQTHIMAVSVTFAIVGALAAGRMVERVGPRRVLLSVLSVFCLAMLVEAVTGSAALMWVLGPIVGIGLGSVWTSDRVFMLRLTPPEMLGEFFSIYNLMGKAASAIGPVMWGGTVYLLHDRSDVLTRLEASRVALVVLVIAAVAGMLIIRTLDDSERDHRGDGEATETGPMSSAPAEAGV